MRLRFATVTTAFLLFGGCVAFAQQGAAPAPAAAPRAAAPARARAPLFFHEEWKQTPAGGEHPVTPESISNPNLELKLYGSTNKIGEVTPEKGVLLTGSATDETNPTHVWTGMCTTPCAVTFKDKNNLADLSGLARIKWVTKVSGFHQVRPIVKLADGTWLVGDHADGSTVDWLTSEFSVSEVRWLRLDINNVVTKGNFVEKPDLAKVDEIGFADLLPGSGHGAGGWIDVAAIDVYGKAVKRQ